MLHTSVQCAGVCRDGGSCSARVACKLGRLSRLQEEGGAVVEAATLLLPALSPSTKYAAFAETLARARDGDTESCAAECSRCLDI